MITVFNDGGFSPPRSVILRAGGFALVRRWIQTPSVAKVRSATNTEGEVVLGASPPARLPPQAAGGPVGIKTRARAKPVRALRSAAQALTTRPALCTQDGVACSVDST